MIERNELITVCRQIGGMMEAGVDILRITRVMRAQTENPRLLQLYDALDHDMTMGRSLAEAMSRAPDVFSPFVVQIVQQGEARNDLSGAFLKVADFLHQEQELAHEEAASIRETSHRHANDDSDHTSAPANASLTPNPVSASPLTVIALDGLVDRLQIFLLRTLTVMSGLMLSLACVWWSLELGFVERRWSLPLAFSVTAVFLGVAGILIQRRIDSERRCEARCSFCGRQGIALQRSPRFAGAAICARCATIVSQKTSEEDASSASDTSLADKDTTSDVASDNEPGASVAGIHKAVDQTSGYNESARNEQTVHATTTPSPSENDVEGRAENHSVDADTISDAGTAKGPTRNVPSRAPSKNSNAKSPSRHTSSSSAASPTANHAVQSQTASDVADEEDYE